MSEPFLAEVRIVGFNFAPRGWALCDGQILPISQYTAVFSLMGTTYGGDGRTTFGLPDLRGRVPLHPGGNGVTWGQKSGYENVSLTSQQIPNHTHTLSADGSDAVYNFGNGNMLAKPQIASYSPPENLTQMPSGAISTVGGSQGHNNLMPYLTMNFCIALQGTFPSRN